jgi:hypothetical protein
MWAGGIAQDQDLFFLRGFPYFQHYESSPFYVLFNISSPDLMCKLKDLFRIIAYSLLMDTAAPAKIKQFCHSPRHHAALHFASPTTRVLKITKSPVCNLVFMTVFLKKQVLH